MSDPRRLLDDGHDLGPGLDLLRTGASIDLEADRKARLWKSIQQQLPPPGSEGSSEGGSHEPPAGPPPAGPPPVASMASSGVAQGLIWAGALGTMFAVGYLGAGRWTERPAASMASVAPVTSVAPVVPVTSIALAASATPEVASPPAAAASGEALAQERSSGGSLHKGALEAARREPAAGVSAPPEVEPAAAATLSPEEHKAQQRANELLEEAEMIRSARAALVAGNASEALRRVEQVRTRFGAGRMYEESEALAIKALARLGRTDQARSRAEAFLRTFPTSPHAQDLQSFVR